jgi:hypothetical protein
MFNARQAKHETVAAWCNRLDKLSSGFRDAAIGSATSSEMCGITKLVSQLGKACFIQRLASERIQTVVCAGNPAHITEAAEIGTEEGSALIQLKKRHTAYLSIMTEVRKCVAVTADVSVIRNLNACLKRKKRHGNFSGNENRNARERAEGKFAVVARRNGVPLPRRTVAVICRMPIMRLT